MGSSGRTLPLVSQLSLFLLLTAIGQVRGEEAEEKADSTELWSHKVGSANLRLVSPSLDLLVAAGSSTERDKSLDSLQGGAQDPRKRGFTFQNLDLSLRGAVDPYFDMETHIYVNEDPFDDDFRFQLAEAFLVTQKLPFDLEEAGFELELGRFLVEFGLHNPQHPHASDWLDQPVILTRLFGPDGLRGEGFRLGWLSPFPWTSKFHFGIQNASGEAMASFFADEDFFEERPIGGRPFTDRDVRSLKDLVYLVDWDNSWEFLHEVTVDAGLSLVVGPNATGSDGYTVVSGANLLFKWLPVDNDHGWPFVTWKYELMWRNYKADSFFERGDPADPSDDIRFSSNTLEDWGSYSQLLFGFVRHWAVGLRNQYSSGSGSSVGEFDGRNDDPFRDNRFQTSPLLIWYPSSFSRVRLQYNFDLARHLRHDVAHSVWLGFEVYLGEQAGRANQ